MIAHAGSNIKEYFKKQFGRFSNTGNFTLIIVDLYLGGSIWQQGYFVKNFIKFTDSLFADFRIIWFYQSKKYNPKDNNFVEAIDLSPEEIQLHDRFLFLFDNVRKHYVVL